MTDRSSISELDALAHRIRACRICRDHPAGQPLPHEPRPVLRVSTTARLLVASQAPGTRVHASGLTFADASGDRLRDWMGLSRETFYDTARVAIVPMGFCFPGLDAKKGDLPPRRECRATWHDALFAAMPQIETVLAIGRYAQAYHFARAGAPLAPSARLEEIVRAPLRRTRTGHALLALPHPSWRNTGWLKRNPWFEVDVLPVLRALVRDAVGPEHVPKKSKDFFDKDMS
jgi:uracil-DNA glycosylase